VWKSQPPTHPSTPHVEQKNEEAKMSKITSFNAQSPLVDEIRAHNLRTLQLVKSAVVANDHPAMVALRLTSEDVAFFQQTTFEALAKLARHSGSLSSLAFTAGALKNAVAASAVSDSLMGVMMSVAAPNTQRLHEIENV